MYHMDDQECNLKKDSTLLMGEELLEMDGMLFKAGDELAGKIGEILRKTVLPGGCGKRTALLRRH